MMNLRYQNQLVKLSGSASKQDSFIFPSLSFYNSSRPKVLHMSKWSLRDNNGPLVLIQRKLNNSKATPIMLKL